MDIGQAHARRLHLHQDLAGARNWGTRENLLQEAVTAYTDQAVPLPDTGSAENDLRLLLGRMRDFLTTPGGQALLRLSVRPATPAIARSRDAYWADRLDHAELLVRRGIQRGELRADLDPRLVIELLISPLQTRLLVLGEPLPEALPDHLIDTLIKGIHPTEP